VIIQSVKLFFKVLKTIKPPGFVSWTRALLY